MSTDFVAGQVITVEDLSNICVDLGATEYTDFSTLAPPLAVNELNKITMDLVSKGILLTLNRCQVNCDGDEITVAEGVCVFENGAKIRLTEPKTIYKMVNGDTYVYFLNNQSESTADLYATSTEPVEGDYVMLAVISESGNVTDKRQYSSAKYVEMNGSRYSYDASKVYTFPSATNGEYVFQELIQLPFVPSYVLLFRPGNYQDEGEEIPYTYLVPVKAKEGVFYDADMIHYDCHLKLSLNGTFITVETYRNTQTGSSTCTYVKLIFV